MFLIDDNLTNQIVNYLASKPYIEVFQFIDKLKVLKRPPEPPKAESEQTPDKEDTP